MSKRSVLFVDDEPIIREAMQALLHRHFDVIHTAGNGEEAYTLFKNTNPDVVITDIVMPRMSGIELAKMIRQESREIPIIFVTASQQESLNTDFSSVHAVGYLQKPIDKSDLETLIESCSTH